MPYLNYGTLLWGSIKKQTKKQQQQHVNKVLNIRNELYKIFHVALTLTNATLHPFLLPWVHI